MALSSSLDSFEVGRPIYLINLLNLGMLAKNSKNFPIKVARKNNLLFRIENILLVITIDSTNIKK